MLLSTDPIFLDHRPARLSPHFFRKRCAVPWYGGKIGHLNWLLPILPECEHYCEPYSGGASVLLNREPSQLETINDIDGELVCFFRVLRDKPDELIRSLSLTPYSREEYCLAVYSDLTGLSDVERARRFFVRAKHTYFAAAQTASLGRWSFCRSATNRENSVSVSKYFRGIAGLGEIAQRLLRVQIENRPALDVIRAYDNENVLFYCDPPYLSGCRVSPKSYGFEMSDADYCELARTLSSCRARVAVSGYDHPFMDELFPAERWHKFMAQARRIASTKTLRQEVLWTNYEPAEQIAQNDFFLSREISKRLQRHRGGERSVEASRMAADSVFRDRRFRVRGTRASLPRCAQLGRHESTL